MKNTHICPKCNSNDILRVEGIHEGYGAGNIIRISLLMKWVGVNRYICCNCGFVEEWIDKEDIEKLVSSTFRK